MDRGKIIFISALGLIIGNAAHAEIYKCPGARGVVFQALPCEGGQEIIIDASSPQPSGLRPSEIEALQKIQHREKVEAGAAVRQPVEKSKPSQWELDNEVRRGSVAPGMSVRQVERAWGEPSAIKRTVVAGRVEEKWIYGKGRNAHYVYLTNGEVSKIQD